MSSILESYEGLCFHFTDWFHCTLTLRQIIQARRVWCALLEKDMSYTPLSSLICHWQLKWTCLYLPHLFNTFTCRPETPGERTHLVFLSLGLRHLVVVDEDSSVAGMVTRKDLDYAAGFGPWRRNKQVPKAQAMSTLASRSSRRVTDTIFAVCNALTTQFSSPGPIDDSGQSIISKLTLV